MLGNTVELNTRSHRNSLRRAVELAWDHATPIYVEHVVKDDDGLWITVDETIVEVT